MLAGALVLGPLTFSWSALVLFLSSTYLTLLLGHSVGMHRRFIHRSYECHKWLERALVYVGVLVGVAGPFGILKVHDHRDWAQRQSACHDFFAHTRHPLIDLFWQLNCRFEYTHPPRFSIEEEFRDDPLYRFIEKTWMWQQLPLAALLYVTGGLPWVVWGIFARVAVSVTGHWAVTYWCHNPGSGRWHVKGAVVQGTNLPGLGWLTYGECWHNNHHAFPESAQIGLERGQSDPSWAVIRAVACLGWAWNLGQPRPVAEREDLSEASSSRAHARTRWKASTS